MYSCSFSASDSSPLAAAFGAALFTWSGRSGEAFWACWRGFIAAFLTRWGCIVADFSVLCRGICASSLLCRGTSVDALSSCSSSICLIMMAEQLIRATRQKKTMPLLVSFDILLLMFLVSEAEFGPVVLASRSLPCLVSLGCCFVWPSSRFKKRRRNPGGPYRLQVLAQLWLNLRLVLHRRPEGLGRKFAQAYCWILCLFLSQWNSKMTMLLERLLSIFKHCKVAKAALRLSCHCPHSCY